MTLLSTSVTESRVRFWQVHVRALAASGLSRRGYCRRHQLSYHALTYWVRKFRPAPGTAAAPPMLVELPLCPPILAHRSGSPFRLHLGDDRLLEIDTDFDAASLGRLLDVLEQRCCQ
jgi:hypothetical protein